MKKKLFHFSLAIIISLLLVGCSSSGAPDCSDSDVKALVIDIATGEIKDQLFFQAIATQLHTAGFKDDQILTQLKANPTYKHWNQLKDKGQDVKKLIEIVDKQMAGISLTGIRTNGKNDQIKKCQCAGELQFSNGNTLTIEYTAQRTEDSQVYVEVSGL